MSLSGVTRMYAISAPRSWRATMRHHHHGGIDLWRNPLFSLREWRRACLQRARPHSAWRWSWRMVKWTQWVTASNTHLTTEQETPGINMAQWSLCIFNFLINETFCDFTCPSLYLISLGVYILHMTTPTACVTHLKTSHTHCAPKSFRLGMCSLYYHEIWKVQAGRRHCTLKLRGSIRCNWQIVYVFSYSQALIIFLAVQCSGHLLSCAVGVWQT